MLPVRYSRDIMIRICLTYRTPANALTFGKYAEKAQFRFGVVVPVVIMVVDGDDRRRKSRQEIAKNKKKTKETNLKVQIKKAAFEREPYAIHRDA